MRHLTSPHLFDELLAVGDVKAADVAESAEDAVVRRLLLVPVADGALVPPLVGAVLALGALPQLVGALVGGLRGGGWAAVWVVVGVDGGERVPGRGVGCLPAATPIASQRGLCRSRRPINSSSPCRRRLFRGRPSRCCEEMKAGSSARLSSERKSCRRRALKREWRSLLLHGSCPSLPGSTHNLLAQLPVCGLGA